MDITQILSAYLLQFANWKIAIKIVSFPSKMVMNYSHVNLPEGIVGETDRRMFIPGNH